MHVCKGSLVYEATLRYRTLKYLVRVVIPIPTTELNICTQKLHAVWANIPEQIFPFKCHGVMGIVGVYGCSLHMANI